MNGKVWLVGAGPGDPELLTVRALKVLQSAEVVIHDRLVSEQILALANPAAELLYAGKVQGQQDEIQEFIFRMLIDYAKSGKRVVRLKGGDPLVFGRGAEEWEKLLEAGIAVEIVPGISSAVAVPGMAGVPVTYRGVADGFAVITGHLRSEGQEVDWSKYARVDTLVILMGVSTRSTIASELIRHGRDANQPVAFVERGSTDRERVVVTTLAEVANGKVEVSNPAVFVAGEVVRVREQLLLAASIASPVSPSASR
jgi:uroporphyrin-III C-methyltransferase